MFKYCPHCQSANISFDQITCYVCPDCRLEYYQNVAAGVVGVYQYQDQLLFQKRAREPAKGLLDLPGGFMNPGENAEQALERETYEELSLRIRNFKYLGTAPNTYVFKGIKYEVCDLIFYAEILEIPLKFNREEVEDIVMLKVEDIDRKEIAFPSIITAVELYRNFLNY